jgi:nucleoside-diphosphate-sugar epimerase
MPKAPTHMVTGALGYSGQYIARRLLEMGHAVGTLTNSPHRPNPFGSQVQVHPFNFDNPAALISSLRGTDVLYNTYWVRFNHKLVTHADAVNNTIILFQAAKAAGVERIVHVSITNPSLDSPLEYFRGKAELEKVLHELGVSYCILRPAVLFGGQDILVNNIAWALRRLPFFGVFGNGQYRLQPIHVDDFAQLAAVEGKSREDCTINGIGPETFTFRSLVQQIGQSIGKPRPIISVPAGVGYAVARVMGNIVGDVVITRDEITGLMNNLLYVDSPLAGETKLTDWAREHADTLGQHYASELSRRKDRRKGYGGR